MWTGKCVTAFSKYIVCEGRCECVCVGVCVLVECKYINTLSAVYKDAKYMYICTYKRFTHICKYFIVREFHFLVCILN